MTSPSPRAVPGTRIVSKPKMMSETANFAVGGASACFASAVVHPIDLAKVRLQVFATTNPFVAKPGFVGMLSEMIAKDGFKSIYAGLDAALCRQLLYGTARIGLNRTFANKAKEMHGGGALPFHLKAGAGMASGALAVCIGTPMDVALVRMQSDSLKPLSERRNYSNVVNALVRTASSEGIAALWKGLAPNILRGMAMNVGQLAVYDQAKEVVQKARAEAPSAPSLFTKLVCAGVAGFTAALFSLPFDLLKSRLQDQTAGASGKLPYAGIADCAAKVVSAEGPLALWTGFSAYYMRCAPHAMILLLAVEQLTSLYHKCVADEPPKAAQRRLQGWSSMNLRSFNSENEPRRIDARIVARMSGNRLPEPEEKEKERKES